MMFIFLSWMILSIVAGRLLVDAGLSVALATIPALIFGYLALYIFEMFFVLFVQIVESSEGERDRRRGSRQ
jgi:hypothetical protein